MNLVESFQVLSTFFSSIIVLNMKNINIFGYLCVISQCKYWKVYKKTNKQIDSVYSI